MRGNFELQLPQYLQSVVTFGSWILVALRASRIIAPSLARRRLAEAGEHKHPKDAKAEMRI